MGGSWDDWSDVERLVKKVGCEWNADGVCDQIRSAGVRSGKEGHGDRGTGNDDENVEFYVFPDFV